MVVTASMIGASIATKQQNFRRFGAF